MQVISVDCMKDRLILTHNREPILEAFYNVSAAAGSFDDPLNPDEAELKGIIFEELRKCDLTDKYQLDKLIKVDFIVPVSEFLDNGPATVYSPDHVFDNIYYRYQIQLKRI